MVHCSSTTFLLSLCKCSTFTPETQHASLFSGQDEDSLCLRGFQLPSLAPYTIPGFANSHNGCKIFLLLQPQTGFLHCFQLLAGARFPPFFPSCSNCLQLLKNRGLYRDFWCLTGTYNSSVPHTSSPQFQNHPKLHNHIPIFPLSETIPWDTLFIYSFQLNNYILSPSIISIPWVYSIYISPFCY